MHESFDRVFRKRLQVTHNLDQKTLLCLTSYLNENKSVLQQLLKVVFLKEKCHGVLVIFLITLKLKETLK